MNSLNFLYFMYKTASYLYDVRYFPNGVNFPRKLPFGKLSLGKLPLGKGLQKNLTTLLYCIEIDRINFQKGKSLNMMNQSFFVRLSFKIKTSNEGSPEIMSTKQCMYLFYLFIIFFFIFLSFYFVHLSTIFLLEMPSYT